MFMNREHFLHKIVATSAFLFALSSLPVLQYFLINKPLQDAAPVALTTQSGVVAGVSTEATAAPLTKVQCLAKKQSDLDGLVLYQTGYQKALAASFQKGVLSAEQYNQKVSAVDAAVVAQKASIERESCL